MSRGIIAVIPPWLLFNREAMLKKFCTVDVVYIDLHKLITQPV